MYDDFEKLFDLEREVQRLSKQRDVMLEQDDAEVTGFRLATILAKIARLEEAIQEIRMRTGRALASRP